MLCECGCGLKPRQGNRFVHGHNHRGKHLKSKRFVVADQGYETPCWIWQLALNNQGYGVYGGSQTARGLAHRLYYEDQFGSIPAGLVLDHLCRVPACVNPDHLEAVTQAENMRRAPKTGRPSRLTAEDLERMHLLDDLGVMSRSRIAEHIGCSRGRVSTILKAA